MLRFSIFDIIKPGIEACNNLQFLFVFRCSVLIGEYNTESDPDCNKLFCGHSTSSHDISFIIKHPDYDAASFSNNVALLRLKKAINFTGMYNSIYTYARTFWWSVLMKCIRSSSATAQPICFIPEDRYVSLESTCTVVGWGKLSGQKGIILIEPTIVKHKL